MEKKDFNKSFIGTRAQQPARQALIIKGLWAELNGDGLMTLWINYYAEFCKAKGRNYVPKSYWELLAVVADAIDTIMLYDKDLPACYASAEDFRYDILRIKVVASEWSSRHARQMGWI